MDHLLKVGRKQNKMFETTTKDTVDSLISVEVDFGLSHGFPGGAGFFIPSAVVGG